MVAGLVGYVDLPAPLRARAAARRSRRRRLRSALRSRSSTGTCSCPSSPGSRPTPRWTSPASSQPSGGSRIVALNVLEVPLDRPLDDRPARSSRRRAPTRELDEAGAIGDSYGVRVARRGSSARYSAGPAIVAEAEREERGDHRPRLAAQVTSLRGAGGGLRQDRRLRPQARACRVLVTASRSRREAVRRSRSSSSRPCSSRSASRCSSAPPSPAAASSATSLGALFIVLGVAPLHARAPEAALMARKLRGFERVLDAPVAVRGRVRRDRIVALHRARHRRRRRRSA